MSRRLRLVVAGACALAALVLCLLYGQSVQAEADAEYAEMLERYGGEVVSLVVASGTIEAGEVISAENATVVEWASALAPEGAYTSLDDVLGLEVTVAVADGVPLTELNFRSDDDAVEVPEGRVAVSVEVDDELGLSSVVTEGCTMVAYEVTGTGVSLLSDDVVILDLPGESGSSYTSGTVVLAVLPGDVAAILLAGDEGTLRLVLPADDVDEADVGTTAAPSSVEVVEDADEDPEEGSGDVVEGAEDTSEETQADAGESSDGTTGSDGSEGGDAQ